jgi:hypothetical protein
MGFCQAMMSLLSPLTPAQPGSPDSIEYPGKPSSEIPSYASVAKKDSPIKETTDKGVLLTPLVVKKPPSPSGVTVEPAQDPNTGWQRVTPKKKRGRNSGTTKSAGETTSGGTQPPRTIRVNRNSSPEEEETSSTPRNSSSEEEDKSSVYQSDPNDQDYVPSDQDADTVDLSDNPEGGNVTNNGSGSQESQDFSRGGSEA